MGQDLWAKACWPQPVGHDLLAKTCEPGQGELLPGGRCAGGGRAAGDAAQVLREGRLGRSRPSRLPAALLATLKEALKNHIITDRFPHPGGLSPGVSVLPYRRR